MIDWNKPLRFVSAGHIANPVLLGYTDGQGLAIIKYGLSRPGSPKEYYHVVSRMTGKSVQGGNYSIENAPEEPNDHLHLYKRGEWFINRGAPAVAPNKNGQLQPKSYWERKNSYADVVVKVPT